MAHWESSLESALLVRPNLMLAAGIVASWVIWTTRRDQTRRWRGPLWFVLAVTPFAIVVTALNQALYGHPLRFGYGSAADLFAVTHVSQNLVNHGTALLQSQLGIPAARTRRGHDAPAPAPA